MKLDQLFSPYQLTKDVRLQNRLVMAPLNMQSSLFNGAVSQNDLIFHARRAKYVGIDVVGSAYISDSGNTAYGSISAADDGKVKGLKQLATVIRQGGSAAILQLVHAGRMTNHLVTKGQPVLAPSPVEAQHGRVETPTEMTSAQIETVIQEFEQATQRAIDAGFDGVELHGANTFLLQQFMSPASNQRTDAFGGSLANRIRFAATVVSRIMKVANNVSRPFIIGYRLSPEEIEPHGLTFGDNLVLMKTLAALGVDYISLSMKQYDQTPTTCPELKDQRVADAAKLAVGDQVPIMVAGHLGTQFGFERATGDLMAVGIKFLTTPDWPAHVKNSGIQPGENQGVSIPYTAI